MSYYAISRISVIDTFRKNYISQIIENAPVREERPGLENKERPKDISFIVKQKEIENFYLTSTICVGIAVVVIVLVSQVFTRKIFKRIITPVDKLMLMF